MEAILFYCLKVVGISAVLFLYYRLFLKEETFHRFNRFYLLGSVVASLFLPLLKTGYFTVQVGQGVYGVVHKLQHTGPVAEADAVGYAEMLVMAFIAVAVFFTLRFFAGILKIARLKKRFSVEAWEGIRFYRTDLENAPFSYFRNLFWKDSITMDSDVGRQVLKHEMVHIRQKHTHDKLFMEAVQSIFWFNPFFLLIKKELHLIHEYLADREAVAASDTAAFAQLLLESHFAGNRFSVESALFHSSLKRRLYMLKRPRTRFGYMRRVLVLPMVFVVAFAFVVNAQNKQVHTVQVPPAVKVKAAAVPHKSIPEPETEPAFTGEAGTSIAELPDQPQVLQAEEAAVMAWEQSQFKADEAALIRAEADSIRREAAVIREEAEVIRREAALVRKKAAVIRRKSALIRREAAVLRERASQSRRTAL